MTCCGGKIKLEKYSDETISNCKCLGKAFENAKTEEEKLKILEKLQESMI